LTVPAADSRKLRQVWSVAIYRGGTPLDLFPGPDAAVPALAAGDVTDMAAHFVADPFLIFAENKWHMFCEAMDARTEHGAIVLADSADAADWTYREIVLQERFHLSYPYVFQQEGEYYMVQETLGAGAVLLYRASAFPYGWQAAATLVRTPLGDPSVFFFDNRWWLFGCRDNATLCLYHAGELTGPWQEHPKSPVVRGDFRHARPAGRVIPWDGGLLRYAQDCSSDYGVRVWPFRITRLSTDDYAEEAAGGPVTGPGAYFWNRCGMHHVDPHPTADGQWLAAVDGWRPR
jgi:hypothetical protein